MSTRNRPAYNELTGETGLQRVEKELDSIQGPGQWVAGALAGAGAVTLVVGALVPGGALLLLGGAAVAAVGAVKMQTPKRIKAQRNLLEKERAAALEELQQIAADEAGEHYHVKVIDPAELTPEVNHPVTAHIQTEDGEETVEASWPGYTEALVLTRNGRELTTA